MGLNVENSDEISDGTGYDMTTDEPDIWRAMIYADRCN